MRKRLPGNSARRTSIAISHYIQLPSLLFPPAVDYELSVRDFTYRLPGNSLPCYLLEPEPFGEAAIPIDEFVDIRLIRLCPRRAAEIQQVTERAAILLDDAQE